MDIEFDPAKEGQNRLLHGLSLVLATELEWEEALVWVDSRYRYEEWRMAALVPMAERIYYVAFVEGRERCRIISLRYATRKELAHYVQNYP